MCGVGLLLMLTALTVLMLLSWRRVADRRHRARDAMESDRRRGWSDDEGER
jgi:hypothetical protein